MSQFRFIYEDQAEQEQQSEQPFESDEAALSKFDDDTMQAFASQEWDGRFKMPIRLLRLDQPGVATDITPARVLRSGVSFHVEETLTPKVPVVVDGC